MLDLLPSRREITAFLARDEARAIRATFLHLESVSCFARRYARTDSAVHRQAASAGPALQTASDLRPGDLAAIGLPGYCLPAAERGSAEIERALSAGARNHPGAVACIREFTRSVCWLAREDGARPGFASTTFYHYPYCTFLTEMALRFTQPDVMLCRPSGYVLLENLFHESLHQQLMSAVWMGWIFADEAAARAAPRADIPWRADGWTLEHVLQAAYVYVSLFRMRSEHLACGADCIDTALAPQLRASMPEAQARGLHLLRDLQSSVCAFAPPGRRLLEWMTDSLSRPEPV